MNSRSLHGDEVIIFHGKYHKVMIFLVKPLVFNETNCK